MKLLIIVSNQTNPYLNVAVENYLVSLDRPDTVTLYLWKNHRTVVVGQNQNPFTECNVDLLEKDGGYVMRRSTGGGAVYHIAVKPDCLNRSRMKEALYLVEKALCADDDT